MTPVRLEPATLRSRVKHSTTEPLRSQVTYLSWRYAARYTLRPNVFVVRHVIYLFIIIPDKANMAKRWILKNN